MGNRSELTARDVMTSTFISVSPDETPFTAYAVITKHRIHHLPVITNEGKCVAMLDAVIALARASEGLLHGHVKLIELQGVGTPVYVSLNAPLREIAGQMTAMCADACCVVDERERMVGLITARDIVAAVAGRPSGQELSGRSA